MAQLTREQANAIYLKQLYLVAKKKVSEQDLKTYPIDPQGRILIDIELSDDDWRNIQSSYEKVPPQEKAEEEKKVAPKEIGKFKEEFIKNLGHPITDITTFSYDMQTKITDPNPSPLEEILNKLGLDEEIRKQYQQLAKGRIIALQTEVHFHAHLIGRMIKKSLEIDGGDDKKGTFDQKLNEALKEALVKLNQTVLEQLKDALNKASSDGSISPLALNKNLDAARGILLKEIAVTVVNEIKGKIPLTRENTMYITKELAEETTGSQNDFVHFDKGLSRIDYVGATENTAHDKKNSENENADQLIKSYYIDEDGEVKVFSLSDRQQVRVPSFAFTRETTPYTTAEKIKFLQDKYQLGEEVVGEKPKAFVYNLLTTLNQWFNSEKQTESAENILQAAHIYNKRGNVPLCLVQNISVNGWGDPLTLDIPVPKSDSKKSDEKSDKKLKNVLYEASLMAQMASLHTIYDVLDVDRQLFINKLFASYREFLKEDTGKGFWRYLVDRDPNLLTELNTFRVGLKAQISKQELVFNKPDDMSEDNWTIKSHVLDFKYKAKKALAMYYQQGEYSKHSSGMAYQALSTFCEGSCLIGCKSANERTQAVNGRVAILEFISLPKFTRDKKLKDYIGKNEADSLIVSCDRLEENINAPDGKIEAINGDLDKLYESLNLEGFQAVISFMDQGAHAKLASKFNFMSKPFVNLFYMTLVGILGAGIGAGVSALVAGTAFVAKLALIVSLTAFPPIGIVVIAMFVLAALVFYLIIKNNTNNCETITTHVDKAANMQAHKGLYKELKQALDNQISNKEVEDRTDHSDYSKLQDQDQDQDQEDTEYTEDTDNCLKSALLAQVVATETEAEAEAASVEAKVKTVEPTETVVKPPLSRDDDPQQNPPQSPHPR